MTGLRHDWKYDPMGDICRACGTSANGLNNFELDCPGVPEVEKGTFGIECEITLEMNGHIPKWAHPEVQQIMDEVVAVEKDRVRKVLERALADHFGAGVLGDQADA
jgi:hypothetical protein